MSTTSPMPPVHSRPSGPSRIGLSSPTIDPFRVLRKHMTAIVASCVGGAVFGVGLWVVLLFAYPLYTGKDTYEIVATITDPNQVMASDLPRDEIVIRIARTEMAYLLSHEVLSGAVAERDVEQTQWARSFMDSSGQIARDDAVEELMESLSPRYIPDTNLFEVRFSATEKGDVPVILAAVRKAYLEYRKAIDQRQFDADLRVFKQQEEEINRQLINLSAQIRAFVRDHNILTLSDIRYHPLSNEVQQLQEERARQLTMLNVLRSRREQYRAKMAGQLEPTEEDRLRANADPLVAALNRRIADIRIERRRSLGRFGSEHRQMGELEMLLAAAEEETAATVDEIMSRALAGGLKELSNQIESAEQLVTELDERLREKDAELTALAGEVSEYESLLRRREDFHLQLRNTQELITEAHRVRMRTSSDRVRLASGAQTPRERSFPLPQIIIPLGFLLVVGSVVGVVFIRELTDKRVKSVSDLAVVPGAKVLGLIPDLADDPTRISEAEMAVRREPKSVIAESYRQSAAGLVKSMERAGHQSLVVVGGMPGSGATTVVSNLAAFIAAGGRSVLCIDANFRRPRLASAMGCEKPQGPGLGDVLAESSYVSDVIQGAGGGIHVIPAGTAANRTFERLGNGRFDQMIAELRPQYDFILIDAPPAVVAGDAMVIANRCDASLLVVRANQEQRGLVAKLISQFSDSQCDLLGVILNRPRGTAGGYFKKNFAAMAEYAAK